MAASVQVQTHVTFVQPKIKVPDFKSPPGSLSSSDETILVQTDPQNSQSSQNNINNSSSSASVQVVFGPHASNAPNRALPSGPSKMMQSRSTGSASPHTLLSEEFQPHLHFYPRPFVFGEVLFDHFLASNESKLGGAPFNVAWNLCGLGLNPLLVSRIGKDEDGTKILKQAKSWAMDCSNVQIDKSQRPTGNVKVTLDAHTNEPSYDIVRDVAYDFIDEEEIQLPPDLLKLLRYASKTNRGRPRNSPFRTKIRVFVYHGTLCLRSQRSRKALYAFINKLEAKYAGGVSANSSSSSLKSSDADAADNRLIEVTRFVDVNLRSPYWSAEDTCSILRESNVKYAKLNEDELPLLIKTSYKDPNDMMAIISDSIDFAGEFGLDVLIVTLGANGSLIINKLNKQRPEVLTIRVSKVAHAQTFEEFYEKRRRQMSHLTKMTSLDTFTPKIKIADTVGAGDSYASVIIAGLILNWSMVLTMNRADNLACKVVTVTGALLKSRKEYISIISDRARSGMMLATVNRGKRGAIKTHAHRPNGGAGGTSELKEENELNDANESNESNESVGDANDSNDSNLDANDSNEENGGDFQNSDANAQDRESMENMENMENYAVGMSEIERNRVRSGLWRRLGTSLGGVHSGGVVSVEIVRKPKEAPQSLMASPAPAAATEEEEEEADVKNGNNENSSDKTGKDAMDQMEMQWFEEVNLHVNGMRPNLEAFGSKNEEMVKKIGEINKKQMETVLQQCDLVLRVFGEVGLDKKGILEVLLSYCVPNFAVKPVVYKLSYLPVHCHNMRQKAQAISALSAKSAVSAVSGVSGMSDLSDLSDLSHFSGVVGSGLDEFETGLTRECDYLKQWWLETFNNNSTSDASIISGAFFNPSSVASAANEFADFVAQRLSAASAASAMEDKQGNQSNQSKRLRAVVLVSKCNFKAQSANAAETEMNSNDANDANETNYEENGYESFFRQYSDFAHNQTVSKIQRNMKPFAKYLKSAFAEYSRAQEQNEAKEDKQDNDDADTKVYAFKSKKFAFYENLLQETRKDYNRDVSKFDPQPVVIEMDADGAVLMLQRLYLESILDSMGQENGAKHGKFKNGFFVDIVGLKRV